MPPGNRAAAVTGNRAAAVAGNPAAAVAARSLYDGPVTHEYVIGLGGRILFTPDTAPTAIAWAADRVLAVGSDAAVRAISRGDSVFIDLAGCVVTPLPGEPARADVMPDPSTIAAADPDALETELIEAGAVPLEATLEPGSPADLAFWQPGAADTTDGPRFRLTAVVRGGAFTAGEEHHGPFADARSPS